MSVCIQRDACDAGWVVCATGEVDGAVFNVAGATGWTVDHDGADVRDGGIDCFIGAVIDDVADGDGCAGHMAIYPTAPPDLIWQAILRQGGIV